jgi:hypothetical protein
MILRWLSRGTLALAVASGLALAPGVSAAQLSPRQDLTIEQITSIFENGTPEFQYGYIEDIGDGAGATCGRVGFTGGELLIIVSRYAAAKGADTPLAAYLPCLERMGEKIMQDYSCLFPSLSAAQMATPAFKVQDGLIAQVDFGKAWSQAGGDPLMRQIQDRYQKETYFDPAMKTAGELGLSTALGYAYIYDAAIQMGPETGLFKAVPERFAKAHQGRGTPADIAEEVAWLQVYLDERRAELSATPIGATTTGRVDSLQQILDSRNLELRLPLAFTYDGESFAIASSTRLSLTNDLFAHPRKHAHPSSLLRVRKS